MSITGDSLIVSDFVVAEFASATARLTRMDIAIASRLGETLATFDDRMANAARTLGLQVALA